MFIGISAVEQCARGIALDRPFWEVAKDAKKWSVDAMDSFAAHVLHRFCDSMTPKGLVAVSKASPVGTAPRKGVTSDANFSNLGNYPFATSLDFGGDSLILTEHNLYNSNSGPSASMLVYCTTMAGVPGYSCAHKMQDVHARRHFNNIIKAFEAIGTVGGDETLGAVAERVLGPQYDAEV